MISVTLKILLFFLTPCLSTTNYYENLPENWPEFGSHRNAMKMEQYKWPNGIIPYEISDEYTVREVKSVTDAMQSFHRETCIKFIPKRTTTQVESILFVKAKGCGAQIGFRENRSEPMPVMYDSHCLKIPVAVQHELFHVTGLFHEHNRPDRDDYLQVFYENVDESKER
jgi:choriolysin L